MDVQFGIHNGRIVQTMKGHAMAKRQISFLGTPFDGTPEGPVTLAAFKAGRLIRFYHTAQARAFVNTLISEGCSFTSTVEDTCYLIRRTPTAWTYNTNRKS